MARRLAFAVMTGLLAACGGDDSYSLAPSDVRDVLASTDMPLDALENSELRAVRTRIGNDRFGWSLRHEEGGEIMQVVAHIEELGPSRTRVIVTTRMPSTERERAIAEELPSYSQMMNLMRVAMVEQIDSRLEKRPFDRTALAGAAAGAMIAATRDIESGAVNSAEEAKNSFDREAAQARQRDAAFSNAAPISDARPTTDLDAQGY